VTDEGSALDPAGQDEAGPQRLVNFRDLGGLPLAGGGVTRPGVLYRSDAPYPGDQDPGGAPVWPPGTVVDLRSPGEAEHEGLPGDYPWPPGTAVYQLPLLRRAAVVTGLDNGSPGGVPPGLRSRRPSRPRSLEALYLAMLTTAPGELASLVGIAAHSPGPVLLHCAAGKDRTGVATAVLLLAAGVEPDAVVADYTATEATLGPLLARLRGLDQHPPDRARPGTGLLRAPAGTIRMVIDQVTGGPGGLPGWLAGHGTSAADLRRWRDRLAGG
jgi:protein-tyrosine phosphatase